MTAFDLWSVMPLAILALGALLILIIGAVRPGSHCTGLGVVATLGAAVWTVVMPPIPASPTLGIAFGPFASFFSTLFLLAAAVTLLLSHQYNRERGIQGEEYPATVLFAAFGMVAVSASTNLLTLFLGVEAMTFAFYILVAMDRNSTGSAEAGLKYLLLGAISAACIAFGIALIYAAAGTLETREVARLTLGGGSDPLALAGWGLLLTGIASRFPWFRPISGPPTFTRGRPHRSSPSFPPPPRVRPSFFSSCSSWGALASSPSMGRSGGCRYFPWWSVTWQRCCSPMSSGCWPILPSPRWATWCWRF